MGTLLQVENESSVSYALKYGPPEDNNQSLYFITKSMTEDDCVYQMDLYLMPVDQLIEMTR